MPRRTQKLTKSLVEALPPHTTIWDSSIVGFGVRRQNRHAVYVLKTVVNKRQVFKTIGKHGSPWTLHLARAEAIRLLTAIYVGSVERSFLPREKQAIDITTLCNEYLAKHALNKKLRSQKGDESLIRNHIIPLLAGKLVSEIGKADVLTLRNAVADGKTASSDPHHVRLLQKGGNPVRGGRDVANRCVALLLRLFNVAEDLGWRSQNTNPARRIPKFPEARRERYLKADEARRLGDAISAAKLDATENQYAISAIELLIYTGARLGEILTLRWDWVDLERGLLMLPDSKTGQKVIRLNNHAIAILRNIRRLPDNPFIIVEKREGCHLVNLHKPWHNLCKKATLSHLRIHDLRHSFASIAVSNGVPLSTIGALLSHKSTSTTARYAHLSPGHVTEANHQVGRLIEAALKPSSS